MNIKNRALVLVIFLILTLAVFFFVQGVAEHNADIDTAVRDEERTIVGTFEDIQRYSFAPYRIKVGQLLRNHPEIAQAFARQDRERLYSLVLPLYKDLREENEYVHALGFSLPDGTVFLRIQNPKLFGDRVDAARSLVQAVHEEKKEQTGYDVGRHGLMYWVARPVFVKGAYAGALELGIDVSQLTFAMADRFSSEVTTVVDAAVWKKATSVKGGFRAFGDHVVMMHEGSLYTQLPDDYAFGEDGDAKLVLNGKPHVLHLSAALRNHRGEQIGSLLVAQDISAKVENRSAFIRDSVVVTGVLMVFSFAVLYVSFGSLIGRLELYAEEIKQAKNEVEQAKMDLEARVIERTNDLGKANESLQEQHRFLQTIIESLTQPFYVIDAETYRILLANKAAYGERESDYRSLTCYQMTHRRDDPCSGDEHPCAVREVKRSKKMAVMEHVHTGHDGQDRTNEIYAYPILDAGGNVSRIIEYCVDVTDRRKADEERKKMLAQLNQMQKMEAIGALAGGIAHDFNNILAAMLGYADLARRTVGDNGPVQEMLTKVIEGGDRAGKLVRQILSFSRQAEQTLTPVKVQDIVQEAVRLLRASIPTTIEFREDIDLSCDYVLADPTQMHQIIMNLCTNAYHAMRGKRGVLGLALKPVAIGMNTHRTASLILPPGDYIKLEVSDTGHGMGPDVLKRIFDPYFTTKGQGEGTGLGLAVVHGIVKSHGGQVTVYSEPGIGTTFNVYLPQYKSPATKHETETGVGAAAEALPRGTERILLVDDEVQLTEMGTQMLESLGYTVSAFSDSMNALGAFQERPQAFDLVITDMTMPKLTGVELSKQLLAIRGDTPIILCTGFSELINAQAAREIGIREFIMKPLLMADIAKVVRKVLAGQDVRPAPA